jgi:hypothetical protein
VFADHDLGANEDMIEEDHQVNLTKWTADKYYTLRLFTYGKHYRETIIQNGMPSDSRSANSPDIAGGLPVQNCDLPVVKNFSWY